MAPFDIDRTELLIIQLYSNFHIHWATMCGYQVLTPTHTIPKLLFLQCRLPDV